MPLKLAPIPSGTPVPDIFVKVHMSRDDIAAVSAESVAAAVDTVSVKHEPGSETEDPQVYIAGFLLPGMIDVLVDDASGQQIKQ